MTKKGRPKLSTTEPTITLTASVTPSIKAAIKEIGGGNISKGIRMLMEFYANRVRDKGEL